MLTEQQIDRFIEITSDHVGLDAQDVIATRDTIDNFVEAQGKPFEMVRTTSDFPHAQVFPYCNEVHGCTLNEYHDDLYIWHLKHQGRLYVVDFGDVRAACLLD